MNNRVHTFSLNLDWPVVNAISRIDRFDASWLAIQQREGQSLRQLKHIATVRSVGSSTRIEGSKMSDKEVEALIENLDISKLKDRDSQEVAGYHNLLDLISVSNGEIEIKENEIKNLHNLLLKYSDKDAWHRGEYKQMSNAVEAANLDGTKQIIFQTTDPGFPTEDSMRRLIEWFNQDKETHPLVKASVFTYEFLSIHPFQDGNGRLSRLLTTLLMLKNGYSWIQYVSFEHEIENNKEEYYRNLMECQQRRPNEDVSLWVVFFLSSLENVFEKLNKKLEIKGAISQLSPKEKSVWVLIQERPGIRSGEIATKLEIPQPTIKRILKKLLSRQIIKKFGVGPGTNYSV